MGSTPHRSRSSSRTRSSKRAKGEAPRAGYDDKRYRASRARLKVIGSHICAWCGHMIDMQLTHPHPLSWSCDHRTPRAHLHPEDPRHWHIDALAEMHLRCNEARGAKPMPGQQPQQSSTSIEW